MSKERNIEIQKRWGEEVANNGNVEVLDEILADDFYDHDPAPDVTPDREGLKKFFRSMHAAFPDLQTEVIEMVAADDKVGIRYRVRGTHKGEFMGHPPTGRTFDVAAMQIARFEDGKVKERWGLTDQLGMLEQLGIRNEVTV